MINILKMDLYISKRSIAFVVFYCLLITAVFKGYMVTVLPSLAVYFIVIGIMAAEERDRISELQNILPVSAGAIVGAKYIGAVIAIVISAVSVAAGALLFKHIPQLHYEGLSSSEFLNSMLVSVITGMLLVAVIVPLIYKFGYGKSRIGVLIFWLCIAFLSPYISEMCSIGAAGRASAVVGVAVCALLMLASWRVSASIVGRK